MLTAQRDAIVRLNLRKSAAYQRAYRCLRAAGEADRVAESLTAPCLREAKLDALAERGLRVPEDYSVCGLDDMFPSSLPGVALTSIDRHPVEIGVSSFELLWQRICSAGDPPRTHVTRVEYLSNLIDRGSCAAPRQGELAPERRRIEERI